MWVGLALPFSTPPPSPDPGQAMWAPRGKADLMDFIGLLFCNPGPMLVPFYFKIARVIYEYILFVKISTSRIARARASPLGYPETNPLCSPETAFQMYFYPLMQTCMKYKNGWFHRVTCLK